MDGSLAIEDNRAALKRIVAQLVEMAGMAEPPTSPLRRAQDGEVDAKRRVRVATVGMR